MKRHWLAPLTPLYAAGLALRELRLKKGWEAVERLRWPVVSIGNLSTGGSGKTPLTIALARALTQREVQVDVLSRGYGRQSKLPARVLTDGSAHEFGDEPLLIAREAGVAVYVAAERYQAGLIAEAEAESADRTNNHPVVHLLDDGFQHRQLHRDVDIVLFDREDWQDSLLPAGNLREPRQALRRAGVIAIPAEEPEFEPKLEKGLKAWGWQGRAWRLHRKIEIPAVDGPVVAFCGIARPGQFFAGLEGAGLHIAARFAFRDHHRYSAADLKSLASAARTAGAAVLLTTGKDFVRLGKLASDFPESLRLQTAGLCIEIENESEAIEWLVERLKKSQAGAPL
jgi:tetraacyldisaccharide 4'-kinase